MGLPQLEWKTTSLKLKLFIHVKRLSVHNCALQGIQYTLWFIAFMQQADIFTVLTLSVQCMCVLLDCKIQLLFQFPFLFDILNQCDNLTFRHFLFSPFLSPAASLPFFLPPVCMLPLRLSLPVFLLHSPFPYLHLFPSFNFSDLPPHSSSLPNSQS